MYVSIKTAGTFSKLLRSSVSAVTGKCCRHLPHFVRFQSPCCGHVQNALNVCTATAERRKRTRVE